MLRQLLTIAKEGGLSELQLSVERNNMPSIKTIQKMGASLKEVLNMKVI